MGFFTKKKETVKVKDGLASFATNLGNRSRAQYYQPSALLTQQQLLTLWRESWIVQKICRKKARDMVRKWREIKCNDLSAEEIEKIENVERQLKLRETLETALMWASLLGGVALLIVTDRDEQLPLQNNETIRKIVPLYPGQLSPIGTVSMDLLSDNFGKTEYYSIMTNAGGSTDVTIHYSRLIFINAIERTPFVDSNIFGVSDIQPVYETMKRYDAVSVATGDLVEEAKIDVYKMEGLSEQLTTQDGENIVFNTMQALQTIKSSTNAIVLDNRNDYDQKQFSYGGLRDLLVEYRNAVAGAADMPLTLLFGQSASGFSSGEEDTAHYHEAIHSLQESRMRPALEKLDPFIANMAIGYYPDGWWFEFNTLDEETKTQRITNFNTLATGLSALINVGVLTEQQAAIELNKSALISAIPEDEIELLGVPKDEETDETADAEYGNGESTSITPERVSEETAEEQAQ